MKTSQMIAMLEKNPKLSFKRKNKEDIYKICDMGFLASIEGHSITPNLRLDDDWQLIHEPVPVEIAIKALREGKRIKVITSNGHEYYLDPQDNECVSTHTLLTGRWYIEDSDES